MSTIITKYWVEANVDGVPKTVPHNEKGDHLFFVKKPAEKFIKNLRKSNPKKAVPTGNIPSRGISRTMESNFLAWHISHFSLLTFNLFQ